MTRTRNKPLPPVAKMRRRFELSPGCPSGLRWSERASLAKRGHCAGTRQASGLWAVYTGGGIYSAARIVWLIATGEDPGQKFVARAAMGGASNHIENLYLTTRSELAQSARRANDPNATSPFRGVVRTEGGWLANLTIDGARTNVGYYPTQTLAAMAYNRAALEAFGKHAWTNDIVNPGQRAIR